MKRKLFEVNPHWRFLTENYSIEQAFSYFAPYRGANIQVKRIDSNTVESSMRLVPSNTNYVGTHFGGSLYSMCDPFFMLILIEQLGPEYIVWDQAASIQFVKPGRGIVRARFHIPSSEIEDIRNALIKQRKLSRSFDCQVIDNADNVVATLQKELYIRRHPNAAKS